MTVDAVRSHIVGRANTHAGNSLCGVCVGQASAVQQEVSVSMDKTRAARALR
jgi:hypothetical protein